MRLHVGETKLKYAVFTLPPVTEMRPEGLFDFEVALVRWPEELDRIEWLRTLGVPRPFLVGEDLGALEICTVRGRGYLLQHVDAHGAR